MVAGEKIRWVIDVIHGGYNGGSEQFSHGRSMWFIIGYKQTQGKIISTYRRCDGKSEKKQVKTSK